MRGATLRHAQTCGPWCETTAADIAPPEPLLMRSHKGGFSDLLNLDDFGSPRRGHLAIGAQTGPVGRPLFSRKTNVISRGVISKVQRTGDIRSNLLATYRDVLATYWDVLATSSGRTGDVRNGAITDI